MTYLSSRNSKGVNCHSPFYKHKNTNISDPDCERPSSYVNSSSYLIFEDSNQYILNAIAQKRNYNSTLSTSSQNAMTSKFKKPKFSSVYDDLVIQDEMYHHPCVKKPSWTWNNLYANTEMSKRRSRFLDTRSIEKKRYNNECYSDKSGYSTPPTKSNSSEFILEDYPMIKLTSVKHPYFTDNVTSKHIEVISDDISIITANDSIESNISYTQSLGRLSNCSPYLITLKDLTTKN
ncbi:hypothetical protein D499_0R00570 [Hanseniaspora uvarum DSM 2768]|nr:hypothetical protein D499_0R00570 [Hanseniaspora uvarum DSM 2768]